MAEFKHLDALLQGFVDGGLPGCAMQITQRGKTIYEGYFGYADVENKVPVTKDSLFRLASMSKLPLYTTAMILYERGKFILTEPVSMYLPEWKDLKRYEHLPNGDLKIVPCERPMLISDILSMKCGLPYCNSPAYSPDPTVQSMQECMKPLWEKGKYSVQEHIAAMSKAILQYEPGTHWSYGFSSEITAALIEKVCDKPINDVFKELLFDPLGMDSTRAKFFDGAKERLVKMYARKEDNSLEEIVNSPFDRGHLPETETGWGRLFSNVNDYSKLIGMLANGGEFGGVKIMGRKTIDTMRSNGLDAEMLNDFESDGAPYNYGYGYGYGVRTLIDKARGNHNGSLGSFGWTGGFGTWCEADPEDAVSIVYMHNQSPNMELYYHHHVRNVAYGCLE
ncbi:MAG: serine hydrolase [Oscillospiraceae bacterium]|nr:serine hydrolase [Oscillospiraceae bacterium]